MKIAINFLLLALCVFSVRVSTQPTPTVVPDVSEFESESELSEAGENAAEAAEEGNLPIGATSQPDPDSDSSSSEEEEVDVTDPNAVDGTDAPDAEDTTPAPFGGLAGAGGGAAGNNFNVNGNAVEADAGDSSGAVLGMKASDQAVRAGGFSATAVGVATTLGIVGALAAAAGIILYIRKK
ncbi:uncharacterized protein [Antedon mediterranea]|uniref:uncharacterized protein n=1 Tax=Antedon mediterranea TaxID=105859 RepID=UPI003AF5A0E9